MGQGPVGQAAIILAKALGAQTIAVDIAEERLEMAKQIGADEVLLGDDNMVENVMKMTGGKGGSGKNVGKCCIPGRAGYGNLRAKPAAPSQEPDAPRILGDLRSKYGKAGRASGP